MTTTTAPHTTALIEDALFLLDAGEHPERICQRLGTTAANLEITLRRHGYREQARPFSALISTQRRQRAAA